MIMKKVIIDGKELYVAITREEAKEEIKNGNEKLVFTDEDERDDLYDEIEDEEDEEDNEEYEEEIIENEDNEEYNENERRTNNNTNAKRDDRSRAKGFRFTGDFSSDIFKGIHINEQEISKQADKLRKSINSMVDGVTKNLSSFVKIKKDDSRNPKSKTSKLLKVLPFMEEEDIHDLIVDLMNNEESLKDINIAAILPFLSDEDCDALFLKTIEQGCTNYNPSQIAPFVSEECLSKIVDKYIDGEFPDLNVDSLYPFLSSKDIKRLFKHIMNQDK